MHKVLGQRGSSSSTTPLEVNLAEFETAHLMSRECTSTKHTHVQPTEFASILKTKPHPYSRVVIKLSTFGVQFALHRDPFAVADALSIPDSDCVTIELIEPESTGYTLVPLPKDTHKWYYCHEQRPDQVLLFKTWDSMTDGRARRVPHASFTDPRALDGPPRESIEVRAFIFHPDDTT